MQSVLQGCLVYHWVNNLHLYSFLKSDRQITLETMTISMASWFINIYIWEYVHVCGYFFFWGGGALLNFATFMGYF